jgi:hypothetical protein
MHLAVEVVDFTVPWLNGVVAPHAERVCLKELHAHTRIHLELCLSFRADAAKWLSAFHGFHTLNANGAIACAKCFSMMRSHCLRFFNGIPFLVILTLRGGLKVQVFLFRGLLRR